MTPHPTCKEDPKKRRLCPSCLYWDPRPEEGSGPGMGYCTERDIITSVRCECDLFEQATKTKVEARDRALYGEINEESEE
ncbi:MAG: hypothetical protein QG582_228 [Candidatus Thermoplasmatota archaeon]|nr:hypothetical protein [Candidatus Thermoplasmatota archaeon]